MSGGFIPTSPLDGGAQGATPQAPVSRSSPVPSRRLTTTQERRLIDYLDERFMDLNRAYKKRFQPDASISTLSSFLAFLRPMLSVILLIPPFDPSAALRVSYLLRLTGDFVDSVTGYSIPSATLGDSLDDLINWLSELDKGWHAVLSSERWDSDQKTGIPLVAALSRPVSQTDRIRLRSILQMGKEKMERWLSEVGGLGPDTQVDIASSFYRTLGDLGEMRPERSVIPYTAEPEPEDLIELPMEDFPELDL